MDIRSRFSSARLIALSGCLIFAATCQKTGISMLIPQAIAAQNTGDRPLPAPVRSYATLADHVTGAPLVIKIQPKKQMALPEGAAGHPAPGFSRVLISAKVTGLIRGDAGIAPAISFIADLPLTARGKTPKMDKTPALVFAKPGGRADFIQLVSRNALLKWTPETEVRVRAIVNEALRPDAPPPIVAVGDAFHISGTIAGEGETQIFLKTATGAPVSLSIVRSASAPARWGVSLGEVVDDSAAVPQRDTLLWYRLACFLPPSLPAESIRTLPVVDAEAAQRDYAFVLQGLGTCPRT